MLPSISPVHFLTDGRFNLALALGEEAIHVVGKNPDERTVADVRATPLTSSSRPCLCTQRLAVVRWADLLACPVR